MFTKVPVPKKLANYFKGFCEGFHFLSKGAGFRPATLLKITSITGIAAVKSLYCICNNFFTYFFVDT